MIMTQLPGLPEKRAFDFQMDEFNPPLYARVIYVPQESRPDRKTIEVQAFQVDENGAFVAAPNGAASRTAGTVHVIAVSEIGDTQTFVPGWVRVVGDYSETPSDNQNGLPAECQVLDVLPVEGEVGDLAYVNPTMYRWDKGLLIVIMEGKVKELMGMLRNAEAISNLDI